MTESNPLQQSVELEHAGLTLRGTVYRPGADRHHPRRRPCVLLLHGLTGHRMESGYLFVDLGRSLAQAGVAAVAFDFGGCGESDGSFEVFLPSRAIEQAERISHWLAGQPFVDRRSLGLLGFSLGGLVATNLILRLRLFHRLALLGPTTGPNAARYVREANPGGGELMSLGPHRLDPSFISDAERCDPLEELARAGDRGPTPPPSLLIQAGADKVVPEAVSLAYARALEAAGQPPLIRRIEGANHGFTGLAWRDELRRAVVDWFTQRPM